MKKSIDHAIIRVVIATGISSVVTQLLTIREVLTQFELAGHEAIGRVDRLVLATGEIGLVAGPLKAFLPQAALRITGLLMRRFGPEHGLHTERGEGLQDQLFEGLFQSASLIVPLSPSNKRSL